MLAIVGLFFDGFFKATGDVLSRSLKEVDTSIIMFFHGLCGLTMSSAYLLVSSDADVTGHSMEQYLLLAFSALFTTIALLANIIAF